MPITHTPVIQYTALTGPVVVPPVIVPERAWAPRYPDRIPPPPGLHASRQQAFALWSQPLPADLTPLAWQGTFPAALAARPALRTALQPFLSNAPGTMVALAPPLSWAPTYPDASARTWVLELKIRGKPPKEPKPPKDPVFPPAFPVPDRSWAGTYPDLLGRRALAVVARTSAVGPVDPVADVVVPALSWQGVYPPHLSRPLVSPTRWPWAAQPVDPLAEAAFVPLCWAPQYPDRLARRDLPSAVRPVYWEAPPSETVTTSSAAWLPIYPIRLTRAPRLAEDPGGRVTPLLLTTIADEVGCIILVNEDVAQAQLRALDVTQAVLVLPESLDETDPPVEVC